MNISNEKCDLLQKDVTICPLKHSRIKDCYYSVVCNIKRKNKKYIRNNNINKNNTECDMLDCSNNIDNHCDNKHKINNKAVCDTFMLNKEYRKMGDT